MLRFFRSAPQLTLRNHFEFGFSANNPNLYQVKLGRLERTPDTGLIESAIAAEHIYENRHQLPVQLCLSGGIDSEAMLQSFLLRKIPFEIYFLKFKDDWNDFDIRTNIEICKKLNLDFKMIDLDVIQFFESGDYLNYGALYRCQSPQLAVHMWLLDQLDGMPVLAGNPIFYTQINNRPFFIGLPGDLHCAYFRYFQVKKRFGVPWFFLYSPEQTSAFLRTEIAQTHTKKLIRPEEYTYFMKCLQYQQAGFDVQPRHNKFTGFEKIRQHYDLKMGTQAGTGFDELFRRPLEKLHAFPQQYVQLVPIEYLPKS